MQHTPADNDHSPSSAGHVKYPKLAREPSALESIRAFPGLRSLPAALTTKNPPPSPPLTHQSAAYGSFVRKSKESPPPPSSLLDLPQGMMFQQSHVQHLPQPQHVLWASWDSLRTVDGYRQLLILAYLGGLQIWDTSELDAVREVLNIDLHSIAPNHSPLRALLLPQPLANDHYPDQRPILAVLTRHDDGSYTDLLFYSLRTHSIVKRFSPSDTLAVEQGEQSFSNLISIQASPNVIVLGSHSPSQIHILSSTTFHHLHTIQSPHLTSVTSHRPHQPIFTLSNRLLAFASPPPLPHHRIRNPGPGFLSSASSGGGPSPTNTLSEAAVAVGASAKKVGEGVWMGVRALSGLAFGNGNSPTSGNGDMGRSSSTPFFSSRSAPGPSPSLPVRTPSPHGPMLMSPMHSPPPRGHVSPSSPKYMESSVLNPPIESGYVTILDLGPLFTGASAEPVQVAHFLATSVSGMHGSAVHALRFSPSGTLLCVADVNGNVLKVFQVRGMNPHRFGNTKQNQRHVKKESSSSNAMINSPPSSFPGQGAHIPNNRRRSSGASTSTSTSTVGGSTNVGQSGDSVWHLYDLMRGTTSAKVENIVWSRDMRWIGVGTQRGTLHVFAVNPYGGKPDEASHLEGKVKNPMELQPLSVAVHPVARLRAPTTVATAKDRSAEMGGNVAPVTIPAYLFIPTSISQASSLLPPSSSNPNRGNNSNILKRNTSTTTGHTSKKVGTQDVLVMVPANGTMSLQRCTIHLVDPVGVTPDATRRSGSEGSLSRSLPASGVSLMMSLMNAGTTTGGIVGVVTNGGGLRASEVAVASWDVGRENGWGEVRDAISPAVPVGDKHHVKSDWLSQAELSTTSKSPRILPPSIYLSHQFNFYGLANQDYVPLLLKAQFDLPIAPLKVRKQVEITPSPRSRAEELHYGGHKGFMEIAESFDNETSLGREPSSFDEPLASAIHTKFEPEKPLEPVIPMYPNAGGGDGGGRSWIPEGVPIGVGVVRRTVIEGIEGMMREVKKKQQQSQQQQRAKNQVAEGLIFDEEDREIFVKDEGVDHTGSTPSMSDTTNVTSPSYNNQPLGSSSVEDEGDKWRVEPEEEDAYVKAVEEEQRFDDLEGFMMEKEDQKEREGVEGKTLNGAGRKRRTKKK
ncbi:hypothetical protein FRC03_001135 [Tulasnella sp. 419]|nr:hypothetical protein FRC03_001135 [Tulasnella sp. 419]